MEIALLKFSISLGENTKQIAPLSDANLDSIKLANDGKQIAFTARRDGNDNFYLVSADSGEIRQLSANLDSTLYYSGLTWSPDGKMLYYSKQTGGLQISMITNPK